MTTTYLSRKKKFFCTIFRKRPFSANLRASLAQSVTSSHAKGLRARPFLTFGRRVMRAQMPVDFTLVIK
jgi:hypothetical protein